MTLVELRRLAVRRQSRIRFRLENGLECVIDEHGIARVPELRAVPDFNLEQELAKASEFALEPVDRDRKTVPAGHRVGREALAAMLTASAQSGASAAHADHDDE